LLDHLFAIVHRFFLLDTPIVPGAVVELTPIAHQLRTVLRLRSGDQIQLLDGLGRAFRTEIREIDRRQVSGYVVEEDAVTSEPHCYLILYQCALKADKFEWVLQKGTEIGVSHFIPVISNRTVVRPAEKIRKKYDRWHAIIREAAEQSGRGRLPTLGDPMAWAEAILSAQGLRLLPWEEVTAQPEASPLLAALATAKQGEAVNLLIGPEGGIEEDEIAQAIRAGWCTISLGRRILRAETAALVASALVLHHLDGGV
jgi:16S rRNA (uracil1498-N3)-methyltransferase